MQLIAGVGVGLGFQPLLIAFQSCVKQDDMAAATALFGFVRSIATSVSIVVGGVVLQNRMQSHQKYLRLALPSDVSQMFSGDAATANVQFIKTLTTAQSAMVRVAYGNSLSDMWILYCSFAAVGLLISLLIVRVDLSTEHVETRTGIEKPEMS